MKGASMASKGRVLFIIHDNFKEDNVFPLGAGYPAPALRRAAARYPAPSGNTLSSLKLSCMMNSTLPFEAMDAPFIFPAVLLPEPLYQPCRVSGNYRKRLD